MAADVSGDLVTRLTTHRASREFKGASPDTLALLDEAIKAAANSERWRLSLNDALSQRDYWQSIAEQKIGLRRELEEELFGEFLPLQPDGGEAIHRRALARIRELKAGQP